MKLRSVIDLHGGGPGSGCNPDVGKCGRPKTRVEDESVGFVSPNVEENLSFHQALLKLNSPEQKTALVRAQTLVNGLFGNGQVTSAIGDWSDGAENSTVVEVDTEDKDRLDYAMAQLGQQLNQKAVVSFSHDMNGQDAVWTMPMAMSLDKARTALQDSGIDFRTLVPEQDGSTTVHVFDPGMKMAEKIHGMAQKYSLEVHLTPGTGHYIGGDTREAGQKAYEQVIGNYKALHQIRSQAERKGQRRVWIFGSA